jgi:pimeloyl-ACP methyl ester carboxylesterase
MTTTMSTDGTRIAFDRAGQGPAVIVVDGALCYRASGPSASFAELLTPHFTVFTYDRRGRGDSGNTAPYATEREVEDLAALYEAPFIIDGTHAPIPPDFQTRLQAAVAADRRSDAVSMFLKLVGVPAVGVAIMRLLPVWKKLTAVAHTLPNDIMLVEANQRGTPLTTARWNGVTVATLAMDGGKSPEYMRNGMRALAAALPNATYRTLPGQTHMVNAKAVVPPIVEFFTHAS